MRMTHVDFVASARLSSRMGAILFVAGALLAGGAVMDDASRSEELLRTQQQLKKARVAYKRVEAAHAPAQSSDLAGFKQPSDIAQRLTLPWGHLLDALENADNENVALLAIEPDADRGRLRLTGEAKSLEALVDYIKALDGKAGIAELRLMTQQVKQSDAQHPVEFVLESNWLRRTPHASVEGGNS